VRAALVGFEVTESEFRALVHLQETYDTTPTAPDELDTDSSSDRSKLQQSVQAVLGPDPAELFEQAQAPKFPPRPTEWAEESRDGE